MDSTFNTLDLPVVGSQPVESGVSPVTTGPDVGPRTVAQANKVPLRVVVHNTSFGGADAILAFDAATLQVALPTANAFRLQAGKSETFVLAPGQRLFAVSPSSDCLISIHVSESWPEQALGSER